MRNEQIVAETGTREEITAKIDSIRGTLMQIEQLYQVPSDYPKLGDDLAKRTSTSAIEQYKEIGDKFWNELKTAEETTMQALSTLRNATGIYTAELAAEAMKKRVG